MCPSTCATSSRSIRSCRSTRCSSWRSSRRRSSMRCRRCAPLPEDVRRAAGLLERRWTVSILWASYEGALRFNEFKQSLGEIPPRTLAQRLVELEEAGVLKRRVGDAPPPRVEYRLTDEGGGLKQVVDAVVAWAG